MTGWLGKNLHQQRRNNQIWYQDRFVKYPFENGLAALKKQDVYECLMGFLEREAGKNPHNLEDWCRFRFGEGIAGKYLLPYNDKIWKRAAKDISVHWVERIPSPPTEDIVKSAVGIETEGYTHQLNFFYPTRGGIEALIRSLAKDLRVQSGFRVNKLAPHQTRLGGKRRQAHPGLPAAGLHHPGLRPGPGPGPPARRCAEIPGRPGLQLGDPGHDRGEPRRADG